jgi:hypothetical protein
MGGEDPVEAALVRSPGYRQREFQRLGWIHLAGINRADKDAELHLTTLVTREPRPTATT